MNDSIRLYDDNADALLSPDSFPDRVSLLQAAGLDRAGNTTTPANAQLHPQRIRLLWGQDMMHDVLDGRYRAVVCGVNEHDNSHGIIAQLVDRVPSSQWTASGVTSYARMFQESVSIHAAHDREPYVLKYDLDSLLILALLRPKGKDHFTTDDLARGFATISKMLAGRRERLPVATVSFLGARSNKLIDPKTNEEPSFERVLNIMHNAGFHGDVYPSPQMWRLAHVGVFPTYPFPAGVARMKEGSS